VVNTAQHPAADSGWLPGTRRAWRIFWASDLATIVVPSDHVELVRYFSLLDQQERLFVASRDEPLVLGQRSGQQVTNPLMLRALALNLTLRELGDRFGMNPTARIRLLGRSARARPADTVAFPEAESIDLDEDGEPMALHALDLEE
jgi:phage terminase small subunit